MVSWYSFLIAHKELFASVTVAFIGIVKLTSWGRAQASALDTIVHVIEGAEASDVKAAVADKQSDLPPAARDAINDAVNTADPKKPTPSVAERIFREIFRGFSQK